MKWKKTKKKKKKRRPVVGCSGLENEHLSWLYGNMVVNIRQ